MLPPPQTYAVVRSLLRRAEAPDAVPFTTDVNGVRLLLHTMDDLLVALLPGTVAQLSTIGTHSSLVFGQFMLRLWVGVLPWEVILRVVDQVLYEGLFALFRVSLHVAAACQPLVLRCHSAEELLFVVMHNGARALAAYVNGDVVAFGDVVHPTSAVAAVAHDRAAAAACEPPPPDGEYGRLGDDYDVLFANSERLWVLLHQLMAKNSLLQLVLCRTLPPSLRLKDLPVRP